ASRQIELLHRLQAIAMRDLVPLTKRGLGPVAVGTADVHLAQFGEYRENRIDSGMAGIVGIDQQGDVLEGLFGHARLDDRAQVAAQAYAGEKFPVFSSSRCRTPSVMAKNA